MKELQPHDHKRLEIIKKYYTVNDENHLVDVLVHFNKTSDIVIGYLGDKKTPHIDETIFSTLENAIKNIPTTYKVNFDIQIDDYEEYDPKTILQSIQDEIELRYYRMRKDKHKDWLKSMVLILFGISLLVLQKVAISYNAINNEMSGAVYSYLLECFSSALTWGAVAILFINTTDFGETTLSVLRNLYTIKMLDKDNNILYVLDEFKLFKDLLANGTRRKIGKICLLISSSIFIAVSIIDLCNLLIKYSTMDRTYTTYFISNLVITITTCIFELIVGIGSISTFLNKGPFRKISSILTICIIILLILGICNHILVGNEVSYMTTSTIVSIVLGVIAIICYFVGKVCARDKKKVNVNKNSNKN